MNSQRVQTVLASGRRPAFESKIKIAVPAEVYDWKAAPATRRKALTVQDGNREQFIRAFAGQLSVLGFERNERGDGRFLLGSWDELLNY
jgi:hypothetical protein